MFAFIVQCMPRINWALMRVWISTANGRTQFPSHCLGATLEPSLSHDHPSLPNLHILCPFRFSTHSTYHTSDKYLVHTHPLTMHLIPTLLLSCSIATTLAAVASQPITPHDLIPELIHPAELDKRRGCTGHRLQEDVCKGKQLGPRMNSAHNWYARSFSIALDSVLNFGRGTSMADV